MKQRAAGRGLVIYGLPGVVVGVLLAYALNVRMQTGATAGRDRWEEDVNHDGKVDGVIYYSGGRIDRTEYDRNFDGILDSWEWYSELVPARAETDDNFDGVVDGWEEFRNGSLATRKDDTDWNGVPDVTYEHVHGVLTKASWHPNGDKIARVEFFKHGVKTRAEVDLDGDGVFETVKHYDAFGNELADGPRTK